MRIIVFGGDGFCGWPTSLHLSARGHDVRIVDDLSRRNIDNELGTDSLTPIQSIQNRLSAWQRGTGRTISWDFVDVAREFDKLTNILRVFEPDAVVHFAEQRAAPYSMKTSAHRRYTVDNNVNATHNICAAIVETGSKAHLVHLGTMGVYGYGLTDYVIPEGYIDVKIKTSEGVNDVNILHPSYPGSIYHLTKTQDALTFQFYNKNDGLKVTDLHQGIVWGTQTAETNISEELINRFDYCGDYGTVLNRFLMQAAVGYPLTVHGSGKQTRAFIHITDTVRCVELALDNPPQSGERVQIFNQMAETRRLIDLAELVSDMTGASIEHVANPRNEADSNDLQVDNSRFRSLGLEPRLLERNLLEEITSVAEAYSSRADISKIPCVSTW